MRCSQLLLATLKETPSDAEIISHQLMLRAGMVRKTAAGIYTWLPLGLRVLQKVAQIVREEMDRAGSQELLMPAVQPAELWKESKRWQEYGPELLRFTDRHDREFCFGPTHEEIITAIMRNEIQSYKQLPLSFYQIQMKFRDEIRPRFGIMRAREFLMKDAYSFHINKSSLEETYQVMYQTYQRIFERIGLNFRAVLADTGSIGGQSSHEFQVLAESGEDVIAYSDTSNYAANIELAEAIPDVNERPAALVAYEKVATPGKQTIKDVSEYLKSDPKQSIKVLLVRGAKNDTVALVLRGEHELNEFKAEKHPLVATPITFVSDDTVKAVAKCSPGYIGPFSLDAALLVDRSAAVLANFVCGANEDDSHLVNANWGRDFPLGEVVDIRNVVIGDKSPDGEGHLKLARGIEVGHIFQLGNKYSQEMGASALNEQGRSITLEMGCYGIGVSRIVAASIEQNNDDNGIIWPDAIAPYLIALIPINMKKSQRLRHACEALYQQLLDQGYDVIFDDRKDSPGSMFVNMDLIGIPHRIVLSERGLDEGVVEYKSRRAADPEKIAITSLNAFLKDKLSA